MDSFLIGSFQRDTEGSDLISPKLSKGPDRFVEIVGDLKQLHPKIEVILTGKRRQFIINSLKKIILNTNILKWKPLRILINFTIF